MSAASKNSPKTILLQLECHFTWQLLKEDVHLDGLEETNRVQIKFLTKKSMNVKPKVVIFNLQAYVKHLKGKNEEALESLQRAEKVQADHVDDTDSTDRQSLVTWGNYAWVCYHMGKLTEAQAYISKIESSCKKLSSPYRYKVQHHEILYEKGSAFLTFGPKYYERAKECFAKALEEEPSNPFYNNRYATAVYRLEDFYTKGSSGKESSLEALRHSVKLNPNNTVGMALLALKLQDIKQAEEGERYIEEALQKTPDFYNLLKYAGKFYRRQGDVEKSQECLRKGFLFRPYCGFLHHQMGLCYRTKLHEAKNLKDVPGEEMEKLIQSGIFHFKVAVEQKPTFLYAYLDLANMYANSNQLQEAEDTFQKAFKMDNITSEEKQWLHYRYGFFQEFHNKLESEAVEQYIKAFKIEKETHARNMCKDLLKKLIERKISKGSADAKSYGILGLIHKLNGEKRQAIECYEKAQGMEPDNEEHWSALCEMRLSIEN
uniref:Interferon-induced protein with tetratricopeptide repeats 5 n=1 Tax=Sphenodon punctatus TaxID=8508 RepID=A0A8D0G1U0_SPHPU